MMPGRLLRFDRVQRAAHWSSAALFALCVLTALPLYFVSFERVVGRHVLIEQVHVWSGIALPIPLLVSIAGPWGRRMRRDVRRMNRWTSDEVRWLRSLGRTHGVRRDKFSPGQKLYAAFSAGAAVVMLGTGIILGWVTLFPVSWRTGATFVHEVLAFVLVLAIAGHVVMALSHREPLASMFRGWVTLVWAREHAPRWAEEELGADPARAKGPTTTPDRPAHAPYGRPSPS